MPPDQTRAQDDKDKLNSPQSPAAPPPVLKKSGDPEIDAILLPQKEVRVVQSTSRINAGALLEQEVAAAQTGFTREPKPQEKSPPIKKDESLVRPLETYQGDIEQLVHDKNVSVVSIAAAESGRRSAATHVQDLKKIDVAPARKKIGGKIFMIVSAIVLMVVALAALGYVLLRLSPLAVPTSALSPFISIDDTKAVAIEPGENREQFMNALAAAKNKTNVSLGLIARLVPALASTTADGPNLLPLDAQTFFAFIAPSMPPELLRTIKPQFLLGVHVFDGDQPFLIFSVDSYEQGYSGMLAWEKSLKKDLSPAFDFIPSPHLPTIEVVGGTTTPTTTPQVIANTNFFDKIIANHDARVVQNSVGDILLFWTFIDRSTIVITTNDATLSEIIRRLEESPITPTPQ